MARGSQGAQGGLTVPNSLMGSDEVIAMPFISKPFHLLILENSHAPLLKNRKKKFVKENTNLDIILKSGIFEIILKSGVEMHSSALKLVFFTSPQFSVLSS